MTDLAQLIGRLEAASEGNRELDAAIARLVGWHRVEPRFTHNRKGGWIAPEDFMGVNSDGSPRLDSLHGTSIHRDPPRLTTSLDAIVALIERKLPEQFAGLQANRHPDRKADWSAWLEDGVDQHEARAETPALALCIAFLRAIQAQQETSEDE